MTVFAIAAGLMLAVALLFFLPTLLRQAPARVHARRDELNLQVLRDQLNELDADLAAGTIGASSYDSARKELEHRVAEDVQPVVPAVDSTSTVARWPAWALGVALPIVAVSLYFILGSPGALDPAQRTPPTDATHTVTAEQIEGMVAKLAQRLKDKPDDVEGWHMLARSYSALGRFGDAEQAYAHLVKLVPGNSDLMADYADALGMSLNRSLVGEPEKIIERALAADPKNVKALALSGSAAFERRDYAAAVVQWKKILAVVPADSEAARETANNISAAQALVSGTPAAQAAVPASAAASAAPAAANSPTAAKNADASASAIGGTVELDPALRAHASDSDTVFIFARAAEGPRFPLAVLRKQVKDLPVSFILDDTMSMVPTAKLSDFPMIVVGARISKSGNAIPAAGDLEGVTEALKPGTKNLKIRINSRRN